MPKVHARSRKTKSLATRSFVRPVAEVERLGVPPESDHNFTPLGFHRGPRPGTMTPLYPIGYPLPQAAGALVAGWERGPFLISPIFAALSLLLVYHLGRELGLSPGLSFAGAAILGASPTFVFMGLSPMSDMAATFWGMLAVWAGLRTGTRSEWALLAGAAFGVAFLIRPTSLFALPAVLLAMRWSARTMLHFCLGGAPLAAVFFGYNLLSQGSFFSTGYTTTGHQAELRAEGVGARLGSYVSILMTTMGPLLLPGWAGISAGGTLRNDRAMPFIACANFCIASSFFSIR